MFATVKGVKFNVELGKYRVTKLYAINDNGEDKEYNIFTNAKYHNTVANLKPGDRIELKMEKKGRFWNVMDIIKIDTPKPAASSGYKQPDSAAKDIAIARAVALKAAVELYSAMIGAGLTKKTLKPEAAQEEVFALVKKFEKYCTLEEDLEEITADTSSLEVSSEAEYEETPFPD